MLTYQFEGHGLGAYPTKPVAGEPIWCEIRGGQFMCLPNTKPIAGEFKGIQRAVNAYGKAFPDVMLNPTGAYTDSKSSIRVDGRIGNQTFYAVNAVATATGVAPPTSIEDLTENRTRWMNHVADAAGAGTNTDPDPIKREPKKPASGTEKLYIGPITEEPPSPWWFVAGALLVTTAAIGYNVYKRRKLEEEEVFPVTM